MELKQLLEFIDMQDAKLKAAYTYPDEEKRILAKTLNIDIENVLESKIEKLKHREVK